MRLAYVDTSILVAIAFGESGATAATRRLKNFDALATADLLDAELRATFQREKAAYDPTLTAALSWVIPDRRLGEEIARVLDHGLLRGADCWHLAVALYLTGDPALATFLTLDQRQRDVAKALGFAV